MSSKQAENTCLTILVMRFVSSTVCNKPNFCNLPCLLATHLRHTERNDQKKRHQNWPRIYAILAASPKTKKMPYLGPHGLKIFLRAPSPAETPFLWFPTLQIAQTDAQTPIPVHTWFQRAARLNPN